MDMKTRQEHIEKMRASLNTTKTNKEYSAILVHISGEKAEVSKIETALLEQMQQLETAGKSIADLRAQISVEEQALAKIESEHAEKVNALMRQIEELSQSRGEAAKNVPAEALAGSMTASARNIPATQWRRCRWMRMTSNRSPAARATWG